MIGTHQDVSVLRELPRRLVAMGYVDALTARGVLSISGSVAADLDVLSPQTAALVEVFFLRRRVARSRIDQALGANLIDGLCAIGVLVQRENTVTTMDLVILPVLGQLAFVPSPSSLPTAFFGDEMALLIARMIGTHGSTLVLGAGPGLPALQAARTSKRVVAIESDSIALACAELNVEMNDAGMIELRAAEIDAAIVPSERFDHVVVAAPTMPLPVSNTAEGHERTGPAVLGRILAQLPEVLADNGVAQLAGVCHGSDDGPSAPIDLARLAIQEGLRIVVTASSRQPLGPGTPLFNALTAGLASAGNVDAGAVRHAQQRYLASRGATQLYLVSITVSHSAVPGVDVTRHWTRPGGSWQRRA